MFRATRDRLIFAFGTMLWAAAARAQTPPAPPPDDADLEVPASPTPATDPTTTVPTPATERPPAAPAPAASAAPATPAATPSTPRHDAEPGRDASAPAAPEGPVNLERKAHTRPLPTGFRIGGYIQAQYQRSDLSEDQLAQGGEPLNQNAFSVRRARLRVDRGWDFASATLELDANTVRGPSVGIRRAEGTVFYRGDNSAELPPLVALSAGIIDIPFGYELAESARMRWFMERSLGSTALFPTEMDAGAKLFGAASFLRYAVAISNGEPVSAHGLPRDPNDNKEVTGRFGAEIDLGAEVEVGGGTSFAIGKGFHSGSDATKSGVIWNDVNQDGTAQPTELVGVPGSAAEPSENFERWAIGLDLQVSLRSRLGLSRLYAEAFVASNYDRGFLPSDPVSTTLDARQAGGYVGVIQELSAYAVVGFRAAVYDPNSDLVESRATRILPKTQTVKTFSPLAGAVLPNRARLLFQYDFVRDYLARDAVGVPTDADNDQWTLRLQVDW